MRCGFRPYARLLDAGVVGRSALFAALAVLAVIPAQAQQPAPPPSFPIANVPTQGVTVSGSLKVADGKAVIGNNGSITAGDRAAHITLARGGSLRLCSTTTVHLSSDRSVPDAQSSALLIALDRGALEASYTTGKYSDVLMTPDLRILISGPGEADLKIRVSPKGDTCLDNHGTNAPYVTVTSQLEGGLYRVQPNQRVLFEHGSLREVVDNEAEPCGCPAGPAVSVADAGSAAQSGKPVGGPSSTPADTAFPIAQSEGLAPAPPPPSTPVVAPGEAHAQVTVPLVYNSDMPPPAANPGAKPEAAATVVPKSAPRKHRGVLGRVGHFFAKIFGS